MSATTPGSKIRGGSLSATLGGRPKALRVAKGLMLVPNDTRGALTGCRLPIPGTGGLRQNAISVKSPDPTYVPVGAPRFCRASANPSVGPEPLLVPYRQSAP